MACLVTNFAEEVTLFTFDNDSTMPNIISLSTIVSFKVPLGFGMTSVTMGLDRTFYITTFFVRALGNIRKVFLIV